MAGTKRHSGGTRKRAGRPRLILYLDNESARKLNYLMLSRRDLLHKEISADETVAWLIREKYDEVWKEDDEMFQRNAEIVLEGERGYTSDSSHRKE